MAAMIFILAAFAISSPVLAITVYETQSGFLDRAFNSSPPDPALLWISGERKSTVRQLLGHDYPSLRVRYWCRAERSAWILEEVGKELPITVGVIVDKNYIRSLKVLTYRENRGGEVATPAFTDQFNGASLLEENTLDTQIDGISGATLSVHALTKLAGVALFLHSETDCGNGA
jgi:hypothetical protein